MRERLREHSAGCNATWSHIHFQAPAVAQQTAVVDNGTLSAEESFWFVLLVFGDFAALAHEEMAAVEPVFPIRGKQAAALPAIAFAIERDRVQPGRSGDGRPRSFRLLMATAPAREIDEIAAVRREIGT